MRQRLRTWLVLVFLLGWNRPLSAQEDPRSIIDKAIKAHGAADQLAKCQAVLIKAKGTLEIMGGLGFTSEAAGQLSGQIKEVTDVDVNGQKIAVITVFNGTQVIYQGPVADGAPDTPTPPGLFYARVLLQTPDPNSVYGPFAYGLSAHSDALTTFEGGDAEIGIHGNKIKDGAALANVPPLQEDHARQPHV